MPVVTQAELENAQLDTVTLKDVANGTATINGTGIVTSRLGTPIKSLQKVINDLATVDVGGSAAALINARITTIENTPEPYSFVRQDDFELGLRPLLPTFRAGAISDNGLLGRYNLPINGYLRFQPQLTAAQIAAGSIIVYVRKFAGSLTTAIINQFNSSNALIASTSQNMTLNKEGDYQATVTLNVACTNIRVDLTTNGVTTATIEGPSVDIKKHLIPNLDPFTLASQTLKTTASNNQVNLFSFVLLQNFGTNNVTKTGDTYTIPVSSNCRIRFAAANILPTDDVVVLFELASVGANGNVPTFSVIGNGGVGGDSAQATGAPIIQRFFENWFFATGKLTSQLGNQMAYGEFGVTADATTSGSIRNIYIAKGTLPPSFVNTPGFVNSALSQNGLLQVFVDTTGNNANTGSVDSPVATIQEALNRGASRLMLRRGQTHRFGGGSLSGLNNGVIASYGSSGDTARNALIYSSTNNVAASFTPTGGQANVHQINMATNPLGVWEVSSTGVITRMGKWFEGSGYRSIIMATSIADCNANVGSWFWSAGILYIHPYGSSITGKSFEIPNHNLTFNVVNCNNLLIRDIQFSFARNSLLTVDNSSLRVENCIFRGSGSVDGVNLNNTNWNGEANTYWEAGDDGLGGTSNVKVIENGSLATRNNGDGFAPHQVGNDWELYNCRATDNGKQGFVTIGTGDFVLYNFFASGNYDVDIYVFLGASESAKVFMKDCYGDQIWVRNSSDPALITGKLTNIQGDVYVQANVDVEGLVGNFRRDSGTGKLVHSKCIGAGIGVDLRGGTTTLEFCQVLRNTTGISITSPGVIVLSDTKPTNVNGNTTQFTNVPAPESAKALNFAAL